MKHSTERILTTHCGSLPRPKDLLDLMKARAGGETVDANAYTARVRGAVSDIVRQQVQSGVDVVTDGEQSKTSFSAYVNERLTGFEPNPDTRRTSFKAEMEAFPEYYDQYFGQRMQGIAVAWLVLEMSGSKFWLGVINGAPTIAIVLFSLLGGVIADSRDARRVLLATRVALAATAVAAAILVSSGHISKQRTACVRSFT